MKLTKPQIALLMHRLQSGCIAECLADTEDLNVTESEVEIAVQRVAAMVPTGDIDIAALTPLEREVIEDAMNGSTWFAADVEERIAAGQYSRGRYMNDMKAANELEEAWYRETGRRVSIPRE